jgi:hypothetical protein
LPKIQPSTSKTEIPKADYNKQIKFEQPLNNYNQQTQVPMPSSSQNSYGQQQTLFTINSACKQQQL